MNKEPQVNYQNLIIAWYNKNGRSFFWRIMKLNIWQWLLLESLLKKTKAETINTYGKSFLEKYYNPSIVYNVPENELLQDLYPFGLYNQRLKAFKLMSKNILFDYNIDYLKTEDSFMKIPYVGKYIANSVLCFGYGIKTCVIDVNVARVISRYYNVSLPSDLRNKKFFSFCLKLLPITNWVEYNYGLLDIGAIYCIKKIPRCKSCPLCNSCSYFIHT